MGKGLHRSRTDEVLIAVDRKLLLLWWQNHGVDDMNDAV